MAGEMRPSFPKILKGEREKRGLSQKQLAEELGVDERTIRSWEGNETLPQQSLRGKLCDYFGMTLEDLGLLDQEVNAQAPTQTETEPPPVGTTLHTYNGHASYVVAVAWSPRGSRIASAGGDGTVQVWEADTGHLLQTYRRHPWWSPRVNWPPTIYTVAWSPDGLSLASAGDKAQVFVWDASTGETRAIYQGHSGLWPDVFEVAWSPDGTCIASACSIRGLVKDKTIHIWDVKTQEMVKRLDANHGLLTFSIISITWSPDGSRIAAACGDKTIRIWNVTTDQQVVSYPIRSEGVYHLAWSPDSKKLASAHIDRIAQVRDTTSTDTAVLTYYGHTDRVRYIVWSPDGTCLATASNDRTVQVWNATTGDHIYTYRGHDHWATSVAWSPDGTRIASGSNDKTVQIWQVGPLH